jgi:hypothetical protein
MAAREEARAYLQFECGPVGFALWFHACECCREFFSAKWIERSKTTAW